jgi:hypothetical protein
MALDTVEVQVNLINNVNVEADHRDLAVAPQQ